MINPDEIFPIGIGTFGLGADMVEGKTAFPHSQELIEKELQATIQRVNLGHNYFETSYHYANGQTMQFLAKVFEKFEREKLYITTKINETVYSTQDIQDQLNRSLETMNIGYVDGVGFSAAAISHLGITKAYEMIEPLFATGKVKSLHGSNLSLPQLVELKASQLLPRTLEGLYNLECKYNENVGILDFCKKNHILFLAYQPLRRNRTALRHYPDLEHIAKKHKATPNQIIINWLIKHKKLKIIDKSSSLLHITENHQALQLSLPSTDYQTLDNFRSKEFDAITIDWHNLGGVPINKLANQFP